MPPAAINHFHSQTVADVFPDSSDSYSNTPTKLLMLACHLLYFMS
jgi:hypothetical protein